MEKKTPQVLWAQRTDRLFVTVVIPDVKPEDLKIELTNSPGHIKVETKDYKLDLPLYGDIDKDASTYKNTGRNISFVLMKLQKDQPYWPRLYSGVQKLPYVSVDWNLYVDEDEQNEKNNPFTDDYESLGNFDPSMYGGMDTDELEGKEEGEGEEEEAEGEDAPPKLEDLDEQ